MGRKVFKSRNVNHNVKIVKSIEIIRSTNDATEKEKAFTAVFNMVSRIIFSFLKDKSDEYNSMVHMVLWNCILQYIPREDCMFTTFFWSALTKESQKIKRYEGRLAPQSEEGKKDDDPQNKGYIEGLSSIIAMMQMGSFFNGEYKGELNRDITNAEKADEPVYIGSDDCIVNVMMTEIVNELKAKHDKAWDIFIYMHENDCGQKEAAVYFGCSQQYISKLLTAFAVEVGYTSRKAAKRSKGYWTALEKRLNSATSAEHYDVNGRLLSEEELHNYRMKNSKQYREDTLARASLQV